MTEPIEIDADAETVFETAKEIDRYHEISHGAITAKTDGDLTPGHSISLKLYQIKR